ncbi:hypothetical protein B0T17DRAFT_507472 [Bombardia bombarda]|uniref:Uncharacterized protein n=1 Tax=Bombardia bombarda TaxID=252184 RepID=A0AA39XBU4_9PEZI|nr:hypothetical protein B0T17DRAFT_507472 [Bombardia bombarda]
MGTPKGSWQHAASSMLTSPIERKRPLSGAAGRCTAQQANTQQQHRQKSHDSALMEWPPITSPWPWNRSISSFHFVLVNPRLIERMFCYCRIEPLQGSAGRTKLLHLSGDAVAWWYIHMRRATIVRLRMSTVLSGVQGSIHRKLAICQSAQRPKWVAAGGLLITRNLLEPEALGCQGPLGSSARFQCALGKIAAEARCGVWPLSAVGCHQRTLKGFFDTNVRPTRGQPRTIRLSQ